MKTTSITTIQASETVWRYTIAIPGSLQSNVEFVDILRHTLTCYKRAHEGKFRFYHEGESLHLYFVAPVERPQIIIVRDYVRALIAVMS